MISGPVRLACGDSFPPLAELQRVRLAAGRRMSGFRTGAHLRVRPVADFGLMISVDLDRCAAIHGDVIGGG
jgi:hypothetical protein